MFIERFVVPGDVPALEPESSHTESLVIRLDGRKHTFDYQAGRHDPRRRPARRA